jgi:two-component system response regulator FlrC
MTAKILLVEDDRALREALADTLQIGGHAYRAVDCAEAAVLALAEEPFSLVLSDVNMPGMDGHQLLALIRARYPHLPVLLMTAFAAVEHAVDAMRQGAADYLVKPFEPKSLLDLVARHALGRPATSDTDGPVALEPASRQLLELAGRVAKSDSTVLISGESGTGKEVLARYIHQQSPRAGKPFIAINCAAIPDNMLEAILFGHEKGAFTGAIAAQPGKFELANGGTILLDEVSELPLGLQAKLLRVLQEHEVERVGARKPIMLDIRVLATSNRDLVAEVAAGRFREDLFYRLSVFPLGWQPLRERTADILPLAERLLNKYAKKMQHAAVRLSPQAQACLIGYPWPGNVRELDNAIQRALILQQGGLIQPQDLCLSAPLGISSNGLGAAGFAAQPVGGAAQAGMLGSPVAGQAAVSAATSAAWPGAAIGESTPGQAPQLDDAQKGDALGGLGDDLRRHEFQMIIDTLRSERGRRKESAQRLGISPRTLRYKLAQMRDAGMDVEASLFAS